MDDKFEFKEGGRPLPADERYLSADERYVRTLAYGGSDVRGYRVDERYAEADERYCAADERY